MFTYNVNKWYECQKVFWHSFDTRIATQLRYSRNPPNIRNPLIYCVNRCFLIQVQKPYCASTNSFLTCWHWYHNYLHYSRNCLTEPENVWKIKSLFTGNVPRGVFCEQSSQKTRELSLRSKRYFLCLSQEGSSFCASQSALLRTERTVTK